MSLVVLVLFHLKWCIYLQYFHSMAFNMAPAEWPEASGVNALGWGEGGCYASTTTPWVRTAS